MAATKPAAAKADLSAPPPFTLQELRAAIPEHCWKKARGAGGGGGNPWRSLSFALLDLVIVAAMAWGAARAKSWAVWPLYWFAQGTMFWAMFVVGHDCGHGSFSDSRRLNDAVGHLMHSLILVPYHGWRLSHKKHHGNHGHIDNDESWHPVTKTVHDELGWQARLGRLSFPGSLLSFPFYLVWGSPGRAHSHYHPHSDLFSKHQRPMVITSDICLALMYSALVAAMIMVGGGAVAKLYCALAAAMVMVGGGAVAKLYWAPWVVFVVWLDTVTYLHHHGPHDETMKMPWYRGKEWSYLRGGLTCLDRDYGAFSGITHNIGTHVVHHLFPQIPHYHLKEATAAIRPILGPYYREPAPSPGPLPLHLIKPLARSFATDRWVPDAGDVVFYQCEADLAAERAAAASPSKKAV
ncbi:MAG: fatty acid desaturase-domain-containing protein [Monoraphidium minutum]|nr:MAG: fatty acid desaturase-domain-containing protein [Monoraphidium minutum]